MLVEQGVAQFLGYFLICLAFFVTGKPLVIGLTMITAMFVLSPIADSTMNPVISASECFAGNKPSTNFGIELLIGILAALTAWYVYDCWKRANPELAIIKQNNNNLL